MVLPVREILPAFVPLNVVLSTYLVARYRRAVAWELLLTRLLPFMALGLPLGLFAFVHLSEKDLTRALAVFVIVLSLLELRPRAVDRRPLPRPLEASLGLLGGAIHGAFATGGPVAVYVLGRALDDKGAFRATLSALWIVLNVALLVSYAHDGRISRASLAWSLALVPALGVGSIAGEALHERVRQEVFRTGVFSALTLAGIVLLARA